jgi:DNA mismatch repair protein MutS2
VRDVVDKQHYSVDMLVAVIATWGVWNALQWVYPQTQPLAQRSEDTPADKPNIWVLGLIAFALLAAGVIVIAGKA